MQNDKNILIIEPERIIGLDLQNQLEKEGLSVSRPISLLDAEAIIAKHIPDLVIADSEIKKQNFFESIKSNLTKLKLPLIWIGELTNKETIKENDGVNVIGAFPKPFDSNKVVALIVNYFR